MPDDKITPRHNIEPVRQDFYERIGKRNLAPLWKYWVNWSRPSPTASSRRICGNTTACAPICWKPAS